MKFNVDDTHYLYTFTLKARSSARTDGKTMNTEFTVEELAKAISGIAAMEEHTARARERTGTHGENLERAQSYARKIRAAANLLKSLPKPPKLGKDKQKLVKCVLEHVTRTWDSDTCCLCGYQPEPVGATVEDAALNLWKEGYRYRVSNRYQVQGMMCKVCIPLRETFNFE